MRAPQKHQGNAFCGLPVTMSGCLLYSPFTSHPDAAGLNADPDRAEFVSLVACANMDADSYLHCQTQRSLSLYWNRKRNHGTVVMSAMLWHKGISHMRWSWLKLIGLQWLSSQMNLRWWGLIFFCHCLRAGFNSLYLPNDPHGVSSPVNQTVLFQSSNQPTVTMSAKSMEIMSLFPPSTFSCPRQLTRGALNVKCFQTTFSFEGISTV